MGGLVLRVLLGPLPQGVFDRLSLKLVLSWISLEVSRIALEVGYGRAAQGLRSFGVYFWSASARRPALAGTTASFAMYSP